MTRSISTSFRTSAESSQSSETALVFATISHPDLSVPVCVCSDIVDYVYNDLTYYGVGFTITLLSDDDQPPKAQASIPNVDQRIGAAVLALDTSPRIKIEVIARSEFDSGSPRRPHGVPNVEYAAPDLYLRNISCDALSFTADIFSADVATEPWPKARSTPDLLPGLFR